MTMDTITRTIAERIAERLGWAELSPFVLPVSLGIVFGTDRSFCTGELLWLFPHAIHIYSPGQPGKNFGVYWTLLGERLTAKPSWYERDRWTDEARDFCRTVDAATDGLLSYGLINAGETAMLDWLRDRPND